jgi:hypothetical protein
LSLFIHYLEHMENLVCRFDLGVRKCRPNITKLCKRELILTDKIVFCRFGLTELFCFHTNERLGQEVEMYERIKYFTK